MHERYVREERCHSDGDCAFWYRERPNVGLLAAAVWLHGGTALEEYGAFKTKGRGRCDLWLRIRNTSFGCEAKHLFLKLARDAEASAHNVCEELQKAEKDLAYCASDMKNKALALCFVTPMIHATRLSEWSEYIREIESSLRNDPRCTALVWIGVPKGERPLAGDRMQFFPGTFLAIKEVK